MNSANHRQAVRDQLQAIEGKLNQALAGKNLKEYEPTLERLGRGGVLPHWYSQLASDGSLPNLDGKTIGSVVEMLLAAVLERHFLKGLTLRVNPARGVDFPDLDLSVKAPSENYCTSEPFFSAYERLIGSESDAVVLLTNYQQQKKSPPLKLQILKARYLTQSQIADSTLCAIALKARDLLREHDEARLKRIVRFLAFVNQSDWRARYLLMALRNWAEGDSLDQIPQSARLSFDRFNASRFGQGREPLPESDLDAILSLAQVDPPLVGICDALDNWTTETHKDFGRLPNDNEWQRFLSSELDGRIGMSFALQWRYNFGRAFGAESDLEEPC